MKREFFLASLLAASMAGTALNASNLQLLQDEIDNAEDGETIVLDCDYSAEPDEDPLTITNKSITIDLAGHTISGNGENEVISVGEEGCLILTNQIESAGAVTGGGDHGVYVLGEFYLQAGAITGNGSDYAGGGVFVESEGSFTMTGGSITNNNAGNFGGGVYVAEEGTFSMTDGLISSNVSYSGGGVYVDIAGELTMEGGEISNNTADEEGGGVTVCDQGSLTLNAGEISDNTSCVGGGVFNNGTVNVAGGAISGNHADWSAGIDLNGELIMTGGEICGNSADEDGGGVYVNNYSVFTMSGGSVYGNTACKGGGVYQDGSICVFGNPVVDANFGSDGATNNIFLAADGIITVPQDQSLTEGAWIGVSLEDPPDEEGVLIVRGESEDVGSFFFSDNPEYVKSTVKLGEDEYQVYLGVTQTQYPSYLDNADDTTMAYYNAWAETYGADTNGTHETAFLLNVPQDRAVHEDEGESYLKVVDFKFTNNVLHIELASDACDLFQWDDDIGSAALCNGILTLEMSTDLGSFNSSASGHRFLSVPVTINANTGTANVDYYINDNYNIPSLFVRPLITVEYYAPKE